MKTFLCLIVTIVCVVFAIPKPMESLNHYNVVLVHGAAPETQGFESECNSGAIRDAYTIATNYIDKPDSFGWNLGDAVGMLGAYDRTFNPNKDEDYNERSAKRCDGNCFCKSEAHSPRENVRYRVDLLFFF